MLIKDLPERIRLLAEANQVRQEKAIDGEAELGAAFDWSITPEGHVFWMNAAHSFHEDSNSYRNLKSGALYYMLLTCDNQTNGCEGVNMTIYKDGAGNIYCRESAEFNEKFTKA